MSIAGDTLRKLKCSICDCTLSRIPIYLTEERKGICGRCPSPGPPAIRMLPYETLIQGLSFPCMYKKNGCKKVCTFSALRFHEDNCEYRSQICPVALLHSEHSTCEWMGPRKDLFQHCEENHPNKVLSHPCVLKHDITKGSNSTNITMAGGIPFLILSKVCMKNHKIYHCVRVISKEIQVDDLNYTLTIERNEEKLVKNGSVAPLGCMSIKENLSVACGINSLLDMFGGLPNDVTVYWHQYPWTLGVWFCKFRALLSESASYVSVLTIVAFSMERYLAICHPLHVSSMSGFQRAVRIIAVLWVVAFMSAVPFAVFTTVHYLDFPEGSGNRVNESAFCGMLTLPDHWPISEISTIVFFIVPMLVIMVLYIRMGLKIRRRTLHSLGSVHGESRHSQSRKAIVRMLAAVVIAFFICWAPFHAQRLIFIYGKDTKYYLVINEWMFYITGLLYYVSSTVNPILYNVMSNRYRVAFQETLCCCRERKTGNGFSREHSSFRETSRYDGTQLMRVRSVVGGEHIMRYSRYGSTSSAKDKTRTQNCVQWQEDVNKQQVSLLAEEIEDDVKKCVKRTDIVVVMKPAINGKAKCYTAYNDSQDNHVSNNSECLENTTNHVETRI